MRELAEGVVSQDVRSLARAITAVENEPASRKGIVREIFPHTGNAWVIGITGPPGVGKSTLVGSMITRYRERELTIGVIAVDPTSPFTGGAILGDRIRMVEHSGDPGVFIRSMGSRDALGGLAPATMDAINVLDAGGFDIVLVETVGAGQAEVDIVRTAHSTVVMSVPGMGDDVQIMKAGLMEIGDVFVVNKADHPDSERLVLQIESMLKLIDQPGWKPIVVKTVGFDPSTVEDLMEALTEHKQFLADGGGRERTRHMAEHRVRLLIEQMGFEKIVDALGEERYGSMIDTAVERKKDPYTLVEEVLGEFF